MSTITQILGPSSTPRFNGLRLGEYDQMDLSGATITSHLAINKDTPAVIEIHTHHSSGAGAILYGAKSRDTGASPDVVQSGDEVFSLWGVGYTGARYEPLAAIKMVVDGSAGVGDMPGRIVFFTTADGAASFTERLRIAATGAFGLSGANYGSAGEVLTSAGGSSAPTWAAPSIITTADEASDTSCYLAFFTAATGSLQPKTNTALQFNSSTGLLTVSLITSPHSGSLSERYGASSSATGADATAFGNTAVADADDATAFGRATVAQKECTAIGSGAQALTTLGSAPFNLSGFGSVAIGWGASAATGLSLALGNGAICSGNVNNTALGGSTTATASGTLALGTSADATASNAISLGATSSAAGADGICIGVAATLSSGGTQGICIGGGSGVSQQYGIAVGYGAQVSHTSSFVLGASFTSTAGNTAYFGTPTSPYHTFYFGSGDANANANTTVTIQATNGTGNNDTGSALVIRAGQNRGTSVASYILFETGDSTTSGNNAQTQYERLRFATATTGGTGEMIFNDPGRANYDARFKGDTDTALLFIDSSADCAGVSTSAPLVKLDINGGTAWRAPSVVNLTADNQAVTVGNVSHIVLASDNATATNRTFTLSNGLTDGQMLVLEWSGTNAGEIVAATNLKVTATWTPTQYDTLNLMWSASASAWLEKSRAANA